MDRVAVEEQAPAAQGWSALYMVELLARGHGRPAALVLAVLLGLSGLLHEVMWESLRARVFDTYQRLVPRQVYDFPALLIDIDEASVAHFGQWPWPRTRVARLIEAAQHAGATVIGLDFVMAEADRLSPDVFVAERTDVSPELRQALAQLPANDTLLAQAIAQAPVVVGRAGVAKALPSTIPANDQTALLDTLPRLPLWPYAGHITHLPILEDAASGRGYFNSSLDDDGVVRAMPVVLRIQGYVAPSLALEMLRLAQNEGAYRVQGDQRGALGVQIGTTVLPTEADGRVRLYYSQVEAARRVSALAVLQGAAAAVLRDRIALIGVTALGLADVAVTPVEPRMDGSEVQIQFIENLLTGSRLVRPQHIAWGEWAMFAVLAGVLVTLVPRCNPGLGTLLWLGSVVLSGGSSVLAFTQARLLFDPMPSVVGSTAICMVLLLANLVASDRRRRALRAALEAARLERSRLAGELHAAHEIQMGMVPAPDMIAGLPAHIGFYALLEPAREVGGDLYDAFMLDEQHFFFLVGDVAGKGVPASLFMALCTTLCKSTVRRAPGPLGAVMTAINAEIAQHNPANLFVTVVAGMLDVWTGKLELCSAGHEAPVVLRVGAVPTVLTAAGGLPFGVFEDTHYESNQWQLQDGDVLVMMTDGIAEAQDAAQRLYSTERLLATCAALRLSQVRLCPVTLCQEIYADVQRFTQGLEPADDITLMAVQYTAPCRCTGG